MHTLVTHFEELLKNLRPPEERLIAARDIPPLVRAYLKAHEEFPTVAPHSHLVGSYGQDTSVRDVKDVDFLVRVAGDPAENEPEAKRLIQELKKVLDGLPEALGYNGSTNIDIERARRSVHVYFQDHDFHLDVVPCIAPNGFDEILYVPDRGFNRWIESHPVGVITLLKELNETNGDKVRALVKLLKHFRNVHMITRKPKSYWLLALVLHHVSKDDGLDTSQPLAVLFRDLLDAIYWQYTIVLHTSDTATPNIPDPILGHNVSWNWARSHFETFMRRIDDGRTWAQAALTATDRSVAIEKWQKVFGEEYFPANVTEAASRMASVGLPGKAFTTGTGLVVPNKTDAGIVTPIQRTTFHGKNQA